MFHFRVLMKTEKILAPNLVAISRRLSHRLSISNKIISLTIHPTSHRSECRTQKSLVCKGHLSLYIWENWIKDEFHGTAQPTLQNVLEVACERIFQPERAKFPNLNFQTLDLWPWLRVCLSNLYGTIFIWFTLVLHYKVNSMCTSDHHTHQVMSKKRSHNYQKDLVIMRKDLVNSRKYLAIKRAGLSCLS